MGNTSCYQCSKHFQRTREIELFGRRIAVKNYTCAPLNLGKGKDCDIEYQEKDSMKLLLSICPTTYCGANCPFCSAKETDKKQWIDLKRLEYVLNKLKGEDIVRSISITGGEPFTNVDVLNEVLNMIFDILGLQTEISINTNGSGISQLDKIEKISYVDTIHISRHHYLDRKNEELFYASNPLSIKIPGADEIKEIVSEICYKDIFVFNCLLLKGYIDSVEEVHRFLDFAIDMQVPKVGFVTPMRINEFTRERAVSYFDVLKPEDESLLFTKGFQDFEYCSCRDGVYASEDGAIVEFYGRETLFGPGDYVRGFVFGADNHLRTGYGGEIIL